MARSALAAARIVLFLICSYVMILANRWRGGMQRQGLDRQGAAVLAVGWIMALWLTLT
jgi:hypothetical protein